MEMDIKPKNRIDPSKKPKYSNWFIYVYIVFGLLILGGISKDVFSFWSGMRSCKATANSTINLNNYKLPINGLCPEGYHTNQLVCSGSPVWCEPDPKVVVSASTTLPATSTQTKSTATTTKKATTTKTSTTPPKAATTKPAQPAPKPAISGTGQFCGGIAAMQCPTGYYCQLDGSYPDAGGSCQIPQRDREKDDYCIQLITRAQNSATGEIHDFPTPCDVPNGWIIIQ